MYIVHPRTCRTAWTAQRVADHESSRLERLKCSGREAMGVHVNNLVCRTAGLKKGRREMNGLLASAPCEFGVKSQESLELLGKLPHEAAARSTDAKKQIANQIPKYNHEHERLEFRHWFPICTKVLPRRWEWDASGWVPTFWDTLHWELKTWKRSAFHQFPGHKPSQSTVYKASVLPHPRQAPKGQIIYILIIYRISNLFITDRLNVGYIFQRMF